MNIRWLISCFFLVLGFAAMAFFANRNSFTSDRKLPVKAGLADSLKKVYRQWMKMHPTEKACLISDKPLYAPGETIWFSVFLSPSNPEIRSLSEIVYVELLNPKGSIEKKFTLIARKGMANGDFSLPEDAAGGLYKFRAYTRWMEQQNRFALRDVQVQEFVMPVFRLSLELNRKAYKTGDLIIADLQADAQDNKTLSGAKLEFSILAGSQTLYSENAVADDKGHFVFQHALPAIPAGAKAILVCKVSTGPEEESISQTIPMVEGEPMVRFFPEGGDFVQGRNSGIAFCVLKPDSTPADASGWLVDEKGNKIQAVRSQHEGMGLFRFLPEKGKSYRINWESPVVFSSAVPEGLERGFSLSVKCENREAKVQVAGIGKEKLQLLVRMRDQILFSGSVSASESPASVSVNTRSWGPGVAIFSLFDSRGLLRCERMAFVNPDKKLKIKIKTDKEQYGIREKVQVSVAVSDPSGIPVPARLALGVCSDGLLRYAEDKQGNVLTAMLLEQELETKVDKPAWYFSGKPGSADALDLLMLTRGWRGIHWEKMLNETMEPAAFQPEKAVIAGTVLNEMDNKPVAGAKLEIGKISVISDSNGHFRFPFIDLHKPAQVKISSKKQAVVERSITVYSDQTLLYYNPYPVLYDKMIPMAAQELDMRQLAGIPGMAKAENRMEMQEVKLRKQIAKAKMGARQAGKIPGRRPWPGFLPQENVVQESPYYLSRSYPDLPVSKDGKRTDFRTTLFWSGIVALDNNGRGQFSFRTADELGTWRISAQAMGPEGLPGVQEHYFSTVLPFAVSARLPIELSCGDELELPLSIQNRSAAKKEFQLKPSLGKGLRALKEIPSTLWLEAGEVKEIPLLVRAVEKADTCHLRLEITSGEETDVWEKHTRIIPQGYPASLSFSGKEMASLFLADVKEPVEGSMVAKVTAFPDVSSDLLAGVESILREPYGCFEQTSMSSYPNALVMSYLRQSSNPDPELMKKSEELLGKGYKKLTGFETKQKGYEWFGGTPAHEALTAYGLMQFKDMQKVAPGMVDEGMMKRTADWLLSRRDGKGGFQRSSQALDNFGRAAEDITNAYILYGLAEAGFQQLDLEVKSASALALEKKDPYVLALMANTLWLLNKKTEAREMTRVLLSTRKENGSWEGLRHSITYSTGQALLVETTGFAILALIRSEEADRALVDKAVSVLCAQRQGQGGFGNSQSTIVALKALTSYVVYSKRAVEDGAFQLLVNGLEAGKAEWKAGNRKAIVLEGWENKLKSGRNDLEFRYSLLKEPLPFSIGIDYFTKLPSTHPQAPLEMKLRLSSSKTLLGKPVQLELELKNSSQEGKPMSMACLSVPAGCSVSPSQFRELMESKKIDFYETRGNMIYLYFRQMAPGELKKISISLSPVLRGRFVSAASSAYLYYTAEKKFWTPGLALEIE